jgi:hypothetical protein
MDPVTGDLKRFVRMTYYGPTDTYARMGICSLYTDPNIAARYSNPSAKDGRDVLVERRSVKYYRRDGSGGGYSLWYYKAGAVDKLFEYEFQSEDIGMPSPGAVGRPFENLSSSHRLEIQFVPKATVFSLKNEESRRPDDVMGAMLLRLEGAAGAASEEVQGIIELGSMVFDPMKAVGLAQNMGQAIVHWDQTMAAIQRQVDDTANTYWESRLGLINPEDAYRKEGAFFFHVASNLTGGWVVKGAGKTVAKLAGKVDDVGSLAARTGAGAGDEMVDVYRAFGGDARAQGFSWTTVDPRTVSNFRDAAGLPSGGASGAMNSADFLIKGQARASDIITSRSALPLDGNRGGLPELIIDPKNVKLHDFSVLNP